MVVANTTQGYVAATIVCSSESQPQVTFRNSEFYCSARCDRSDKGLNSDGSRGLTIYMVTQSGTVLTIC